MSNPWVILTGNTLPLGSFSVDRWKVWQIQKTEKDCKIIDITNRSREVAKANIALKEEEQRVREEGMMKDYYRLTRKKS